MAPQGRAATWSELMARMQRTHIWVLAIVGTVTVGFVILGSMAIAHVSNYWRANEPNYFNPAYAEGNNLRKVVVHATFGVLLFLFGPIYLGLQFTDRESDSTKAWLARICGFLYSVFEIATILSVLPLGSIAILKQKAGEGVVAIALIWGLMMVVSGIIAFGWAVKSWISSEYSSQANASRRYTNWLIRNVVLTSYGTLLLPILNILYDDKGADIALLLFLLLVMVLVGEGLVRAVKPGPEGETANLGPLKG